jgi:hypothetical protein
LVNPIFEPTLFFSLARLLLLYTIDLKTPRIVFLMAGWMKLPSTKSTAGLIHPGVPVDDMTVRRVTITEETYRALQAEALVCGEGPGGVLARLVERGISPKAKEILSTILRVEEQASPESEL